MVDGLRWSYAPEGQRHGYVAHFVSKLTDADGEQAETRHGHSDSLQLCLRKRTKDLLGQCTRIGQMLGTMMMKPEKFCHQRS
jgi:hypothetical protein